MADKAGKGEVQGVTALYALGRMPLIQVSKGGRSKKVSVLLAEYSRDITRSYGHEIMRVLGQ